MHLSCITWLQNFPSDGIEIYELIAFRKFHSVSCPRISLDLSTHIIRSESPERNTNIMLLIKRDVDINLIVLILSCRISIFSKAIYGRGSGNRDNVTLISITQVNDIVSLWKKVD